MRARSGLVGAMAVCAVPVLGMGSAGVAAAAARPSVARPSMARPSVLAPALGSAADGGAVIVLLKDKLTGLSLAKPARTTAAHRDQASLVSDITSHGGTGVLELVSVNAVAATLSRAEVARLRADPAVSEVVPDGTVNLAPESTGSTAAPSTEPGEVNRSVCPSDPAKPLLEPEALTVDHVASDDPDAPDMANSIATGKGVLVANAGIDELSGNPNFKRADGSYVVVGAPNDTANDSDGEYYGDADSIAGQGTVTYDFHTELPYSKLPSGCTFRIRGVAPDAHLVDSTNITTPPSSSGGSAPEGAGGHAPLTATEAQVVAGIDAAVTTYKADVISESYGYSLEPGDYAVNYAANDAAVAAGVVVVVSSGDSGDTGTVSSPASDPLVIAAGATNTLRLNAAATGYSDWTNGNITPLSSGGTTPNNKVVDIVAPGYGGEADCSESGTDCPSNTVTQAFGGTSEACPFVAGAAADVIQAYRDSHGGTSPTPALVKQLLTSTADDIDAPADQQGAGQLDVYKAVVAAQHEPGTSVSAPAADSPALVASPSQLDVGAPAGTTSSQSVTLFNASNTATTVSGSYRALGPQTQFGSTVTEPVTASAAPYPPQGSTAAPTISFTVPAGLDRMSADMIWPDSSNGAILNYELVDPAGRLVQISYDYGTAGTITTESPIGNPLPGPISNPGGLDTGTVPDIGHVEVAHPVAGTWTAHIYWGNGRSHLQEAPNTPGTYRGTISFRTTGQNFSTTPIPGTTTIAANSSATIPLSIAMPTDPGDHPESVQFTSSNGATTSLPIARRAEVGTAGASFSTRIGSTVGRGAGGITTLNVDVAPGTQDMVVTFDNPDYAADNPYTYYLLDSSGNIIDEDVTASTSSQAATDGGRAALAYANPPAGTYEVDVELNLTTDGTQFPLPVTGTVAFNQHALGRGTLPATASTVVTGAQVVTVPITNTTGVGRTFTLSSSANDLTGQATTSGVYIAAGATVNETLVLAPTAVPGSVVNDVLTLTSNDSEPVTNATLQTQTITTESYSYISELSLAGSSPTPTLPEFGTPAVAPILALVLGGGLVVRRRRRTR